MTFVRNLSLLSAGLVYAIAAQAGPVKEDKDSLYKPTGKSLSELDIESMSKPERAAVLRAQASSNLTYQGGPVMVAPTKMYYIWYGSQWDAASKNTLNNLGNSIGGSPHFNINTTYYNGAGTHVVNQVTLAGSTINTGTLGTQLSDANIKTIVSNAITSGAVPSDVNGVYFVLTDKTVTATSGFCTQYCGWHTHATIGGKDIKYSFVGNPETQCPAGCGVNNPTLNGTPGADAMASILVHELEEAVTDPDLNAWYSLASGMENGDK
ncbi:MAG: EXORDIUM family protein, partial [Pseudomonadota bacterium]|nr:EXORDIUM family protein [Pseudomonadota bacterium]